MTPVRLALVGFGRWGRNYVRAAREAGNAKITNVILRRSLLAPDPLLDGVRCSFDLESALGEVDAVVIATHPTVAPGLCETALAAGKPVLCEKPAGLSVADAERIAAAEAASKAFVLVGHQHLFADRVEFLRGANWIAPLCIRWHGPAAHAFPHWWDYGPHAVSILLALRHGGHDSGKVMRLGNAITVMASHDKGKDRIHCADIPDKVATVHAETRLLENSLDGPLLYDGYAPQEPQLTRQVRAFANAVRNGGTDDWRFGAKWAMDVARILERAESSIRNQGEAG